MLKKFLLIGILLLFTQIGYSQLSKTHYIPPLTSSESGNANPEDQYIYLSTPSSTDITYTIKPVGQPASNYISGVVSNATPKEISIGTGNGQLFVPSSTTSEVFSDKGYIIEAEDVIYASVRMNAGGSAQAGALVSKGMTALGKNFRVGTYTNQTPQTNYLNFVSVMATEDNTQVTFSDLPAGLLIKNYTGTTPVSVNLNKYQSYVIATNSFDNDTNKDGLIGCLVTSDKNIVVNCGSTNGSFHDGGGRDYGIDQIVDLAKVGTEYIFVKGEGDNGWENILIVAHFNNTAISVNGNATATINAGEYYLIEGGLYNSNGNMYVETSDPIFAYQGVGGKAGSEANQGMFFVPPLSCETRGNLDNIANIENIGTTTYTGGISIVTKTGSTVTINDLPTSSFTTSGPHNVDGKTDYVTYKVTGLTGNVSVKSTDELYCAYFNYNGAATSGSFYSGFPTPPEINFDAAFVTLGICIPNITLEVANMGNFDSIEWYYDDGLGSGFLPTGIVTSDYIPTLPGIYKLIGKLDCSGLTLESLEIPVSICPDDIDNDGIIDNIDIDNDNDGILNCTESLGNEAIDLSNINNGNLSNGGYSYMGNITTIGNVVATPFTGIADGTFMSTVPNKTGTPETSIQYDLNFNKNLHLLLEYPTSNTLGSGLLTDDEEIVIRVPSTKTITLLDPDDQLLIDTNYDGIYETGVTQFSSFEIRFKLNGTSLNIGIGTFSLLANSVNSITYIHKNNSDTTDNQATFKLSATCIANDNDGDNIEDALDYDSDNDGIPDIIEGTGTLKTLSGNDSDSDGLDDVFDITAVPIDTDTDGVLDYLDLDSDNDGIYDLEESVSLLPDTDFNGIIDNILITVGLNGWDDNAETFSDSGFIGFTLSDIDGDLVFNYIDLDSDGDNCSDVIEAGFSDGNKDDFLGDSAFTVDSNGIVNNASDGYTIPNLDYSNVGLITIIDQPVDKITCDLLTTNFSINTNTVDNYQWQVSFDNGVNWNDISDDAIYSNSGTNNLTLTNPPISYNNYQYRVFMTKTGNSCGLFSNEVLLTVNPLPQANNVLDLELCDDLTDGDDTNGIVQSFDLESQTATILGSQSANDYTVTYHLNLPDANSGNAPQVSPYENTIANAQTIYVRVENNTTGCINTSITFEVVVNSLPLAYSVNDLNLCDDLIDGDDTNGIVQSFDLESQTTTILGSQSSNDYTVTYHLSDADAISGNASQASPFENTVAGSQIIFVRVENNTTGCVNPHLTFNVNVDALPIANPVLNLETCDNTTDGDDTNGVVQSFDLESQTSTILGSQSMSDYTVSYHLNATDVISGNAPQSSPFANSNVNSQTIFVRVLNNTTGCINPHLTFEVIVHPLPIIATPVFLKQCDNDTDGFSSFNLTEVNAEISTNYLNETFTYYTSQLDAIDGTGINIISNPSVYINQTVNSDIVWARVESTFGCARTSEIQLFVSTTGIPASFQRTFNVCDDYLDTTNDDRDGISAFDFSSVDVDVRNEFPAGQLLTIKYFRNEADALAEENEISDISNYRNIGYPNTQQIYIRVDSQIDNDCLGFGDYITLNVETLPTANPVAISRQCDDDQDGMFPFDTSNIQSDLLKNQTDVTVSYFDNLGNPLPSPLPNPFLTLSQTITIRVTNNITADPNGACFDETTLEFIVDTLPIANPVTITPVCDDESNDGIYDFDTSTIQTTLLDSQTGMEVYYFDENGNSLTSPLPNPFTSSTQTIKAQVVNPINTTCIDETSIDFIVNPLPDFEIEIPPYLCITDPPSSITLNAIQNDVNENLTYVWTDPNNIKYNTKSIEATNIGIYFLTLTKTDGTGCLRTKEIEIFPSEKAMISMDDISIVDDSNNNSIAINNLNGNLGLGDYEFSLIDIDGNIEFPYQDEPYFNPVPPGIYTIFVQDKNNCGIATIEVSVIGYPKFFTPNNDGYNDTWKVIGLNENLYPNASVYIFNRFGKIIAKLNPYGDGWDGYFNGQVLPSSDYWFSVEFTDHLGNTKIKKGNFSLIRR